MLSVVEYVELDHLMGGDGSTLQLSWGLQKLQVRSSVEATGNLRLDNRRDR